MKLPQKCLLTGLTLCLGLSPLLSTLDTSAASQIRITEIMYDPLGNGDKEFVEIYNGSDSTADLSGWSFAAGVNFTFPGGSSLGAGKYAVVVRGKTVFSSSYPNARILGQYVGKLVGRGELVKLVDRGGGLITQVDYRSGGGWPTAPRNGGPSLSLIKPTGDESQPGCWGSSTVAGGSPGFANSATGGGSCSTKAYPVTPAPSSPPSGGGGSSPSGGGGSGGGTTNGQNGTAPGTKQPKQSGQDGSGQDNGDKQLENLTDAQKEELKKQDAQEAQEDLEDEIIAASSAIPKKAEPQIKKLAGLFLGTLVISMGVGFFGLEKIAHSKSKFFKTTRKVIKKNPQMRRWLKIK